jgi:hypothetical protein
MKPHEIYLSRRNLMTLLEKLDHVKSGGTSACAIIKRDNKHPKYPQTMPSIIVTALEDEEYYTHRPPGDVADKEYLDWLKGLE